MHPAAFFLEISGLKLHCSLRYKGKLPLDFIEKGVKIDAQYYRSEILEKNLLPAANVLYPDGDWIFQQDYPFAEGDEPRLVPRLLSKLHQR